MKEWLLFPTVSAPMPYQLALDEVLFRDIGVNRGNPVFRFYFSSEPWISVGYSQSAAANGTPVTRRITGGGRVWHGRDVMFSVIAKKEDDESFSSVRMSYLKIHEAVKSALESLGAQPRFFRCDEKLPKGGDCFHFPIATDLAIRGEKVAGGGQKRSGAVLLHQESIQNIKGIAPAGLVKAVKEGIGKIFGVDLKPFEPSPEIFQEARALAEERY